MPRVAVGVKNLHCEMALSAEQPFTGNGDVKLKQTNKQTNKQKAIVADPILLIVHAHVIALKIINRRS